ncbi:glycosyltransferase [Hyphomicrobium sp. CS1GBMeth3]|uniref:glycosyltransferase n=1 Tax=Hyphomicrobium sp. CS1GBMeth3 TaxID=1892845 RepID=UPI0009305C09|nr:glycosyltransferase [Hyphomicrobium sp. CS1GBMeth3]
MVPNVSIIINTYNRAKSLARTLESLSWLRYEKFEVVVVNGPSSDDTAAVLDTYADRIKIGSCPEANLSMSRNVGLAMASGEIVAYLDDDAIPEPDWLNALSAFYADPRVGCVAGYIRDHTGYSFQCKVTVCDRFGDAEGYDNVEAALASGAVMHGPGSARYLSPTGANSSFRRRALVGIGGFDEVFAYFLDETDVALRLIDAGWKVAYQPAAEVHHKFASSHLRDANRIPTSIHVPARSKAYFVIRHAANAFGLGKAVDYLADYRIARRQDKRWLANNGLIDADQHAKLVREIASGTESGVAEAFMWPNGRLAEPGCEEERTFKPFPILLPKDERLRICFISQDYPPGPVGGIAVWTHTLATALAALGHEVSVVARTKEHPRVDLEHGVWVHRIPQRHHPERTLPGLPDLPPLIADWCFSAFDEVQRIRARRSLDIVSAPIWDVEGAACLADGTLTTVTSLHSTYQLVLPSKKMWLNDENYRRLHVNKLIAAEVWMLERSSLILGNSHAIVRDIEQAYGLTVDPERLRIVPHGLVPEKPAVAPVKSGSRILYVGRFETRKGVDVLAKAIPLVMATHPEAHFVLVGDPNVDEDGRGPTYLGLVRHVVDRYPGRVEMLGAVSRETLIEEYARADIFVAPSRYESFGLIFLEAMMHGVACVGTNVGGIPEVVEHEVTGLLVPSEDPAALAAALSRLIADPTLRGRLGDAGYAAVTSMFTAKQMAEAVEDAFESALEGCAPQYSQRLLATAGGRR